MVLFKHVSPKPSNAEAAVRAVRITEEGRSPAEERGVRLGWNVLRKPSRLRQTVSSCPRQELLAPSASGLESCE